jgi:hypothetical protein
MKRSMCFALTIICFLLSTVLLGCATVKEVGKGFIGVSTQVLEQKRKDALKKSFALDYNSCYSKVKEILGQKDLSKKDLSQEDTEAYIYAQDYKKKFIAIYLSSADTTPVGIFFTEESGTNTLIEVSSPSTYAKEEIAKRIFTGIDKLLKPKIEENIINVKEKSGN